MINPKIRQIIAIIVILSIITGISIGSYFLFRKLIHPPCSPGQKRYSEYDNKCLTECKDDTPNVCATKDKEGNPRISCKSKCPSDMDYDDNDCVCKPKCTGKSSLVKTESGWKCQIPCNCNGDDCTLANIPGSSGGKNYCDMNQICGLGNKFSATDKSTNVQYGCYPEGSYTTCQNSICRKDWGCGIDGYCKLKDFCKSGKVTPCRIGNDSDCIDQNGNKGTCTQFNPNPKQLDKVGYCKGDNLKYKTDINSCVNPEYIGETSDGNIAICLPNERYPNNVGVNANLQNNCKPFSTTGCALYGICNNTEKSCKSNQWQANIADNDCSSCISDIKDKDKILCCKSDQKIQKKGGGEFCCSVPSDKDCFNKTGPYSANMIDSNKNYTTTYGCNIDNDCPNSAFLSSLSETTLINGKKFQPSSTPGDVNYAKLFCDTNSTVPKGAIMPDSGTAKGVCKAICGYVDNSDNTASGYIVDGDKDIGYCYPADHGCEYNGENWPQGLGKINNVPLCYDTINQTFKEGDDVYWYPSNDSAKYGTHYTLSLTGNNCQSTAAMCKKFSQGMSGLYNIVPNPKSNTCTMNIDCNNMTVKPSGSSGNGVPWNNLKEEITKNNLISNPDSFYTKIAQTPKFDPNKNCVGSSGDFPFNITKSPESKTNINTCAPLRNQPEILTQDGKYCPYGVKTNDGITSCLTQSSAGI